ncbi:MAG: hypothetical protein ABI170_06870 [Microbacteriaceae bacterium]
MLIATAAMGIPYCSLMISLTRTLYAAAPPGDIGEATGLFQTVVGISFATGTESVNWLFVAAASTVLAAIYLTLLLSWRRKAAAAACRRFGKLRDRGKLRDCRGGYLPSAAKARVRASVSF